MKTNLTISNKLIVEAFKKKWNLLNRGGELWKLSFFVNYDNGWIISIVYPWSLELSHGILED